MRRVSKKINEEETRKANALKGRFRSKEKDMRLQQISLEMEHINNKQKEFQSTLSNISLILSSENLTETDILKLSKQKLQILSKMEETGLSLVKLKQKQKFL